MANELPLFYHPSNVLFLDDDSKVLNALSMKIDISSFSFVVYQDPCKALEYLKTHHMDLDKICAEAVKENYDTSSAKQDGDVETYNVDYSAFYGDLTLPDRFRRVQVAVIDRHIPAMDGLELCRTVKKEYQLPVKLILLTGATTIDEAVQAFNDGSIDGFIKKSSSNAMITELNKSLKTLAWQQFKESSHRLMGLLSHKFSHTLSSAFYDQFVKVREIEQTIEFYLFDASGSFLLVDKAGKVKLFLVRKTEDFDMVSDLAENSNASKEVLRAIENYSEFPFNPSDKNYVSIKDEKWQSCMVKMQKIANEDLFFGILPLDGLEALGFDSFISQL